MDENFTISLIVVGATTLACALMWVVLRIAAWADGRPW